MIEEKIALREQQLNNLLNKNYIAHLSRLKNDGILNMGRNIVLGLNFDF